MFTQTDYRRLPEGFPAQLIEGELVKEAAPTLWHQRLVMRIALEFVNATSRDRVVVSPIDVFIDEHNVLQPDVLLLAENEPIVPGQAEVALPILVVEVLSPSTAARDRDQKTAIYLRAGVGEVWLVDPETREVEVRSSDVRPRTHRAGDIVRTDLAPALRLDVRALFE